MALRTFLRSRLSLPSIVLVAKTVVISCKWGPVFCRTQPLIRAHFWIFLCRFGSQIEVTRPGTFLRHHWRQQLSGQYVYLAHDRFDNFAIHIGSTFLSGCVRSLVRNFFAFIRGEKWPFYNAAAPLCCVQRHGTKCRVRFVNFSVCVRNCDFGCVRRYFTFVMGNKSAYFNDIPLQPCVQMPLGNMLLRTQFQHFGWQFSILRTWGFLLLVVWLLFTPDHSS